MSVENTAQAPQEEEIEIQITDEPEKSEDELERYTKSVSKRINKLNAKTREAEERAQVSDAALVLVVYGGMHVLHVLVRVGPVGRRALALDGGGLAEAAQQKLASSALEVA